MSKTELAPLEGFGGSPQSRKAWYRAALYLGERTNIFEVSRLLCTVMGNQHYNRLFLPTCSDLTSLVFDPRYNNLQAAYGHFYPCMVSGLANHPSGYSILPGKAYLILARLRVGHRNGLANHNYLDRLMLTMRDLHVVVAPSTEKRELWEYPLQNVTSRPFQASHVLRRYWEHSK